MKFENSMNYSESEGFSFSGNQSLDFDSRPRQELIDQLYSMMQIRFIEHKIAAMRKMGHIGGPVHLGAGQEAIAVGISKYLRRSDKVFSGHRSHAHLLAMGSDPYRLFAEVLGRSTGLTKGMGGSMHLWDGPNGFYGAVPIVAGTVPLAVGAALAIKMQHKDDIAVAYFGDGAIEEGVVHESLNLARQLRVPVLFVCENNLFSSHMYISQRQPLQSVARFSIANDIDTEIVDGNNIINVENAASRMIDIARNKKTPVFIEAITYRHYGHVDWREDIDVGINRSPDDLKLWKERDPVTRLESALFEANLLNENELIEIRTDINNKIDLAWNQAFNDLEPKFKSLLDFVYGN
jgi:TPP-dependent pyruvate/acetoin dehydrogenase alpha subunit